jgi:hypothetical protein
MAELHEAASGAAQGKSPGPDGLPVEVYLHPDIWQVVGPTLEAVTHFAAATSQLSASQRHTNIRLIHKWSDRAELGNWRPIALLNADAKIISRAVHLRTVACLPRTPSSASQCSPRPQTIIHCPWRTPLPIASPSCAPMPKSGVPLWKKRYQPLLLMGRGVSCRFHWTAVPWDHVGSIALNTTPRVPWNDTNYPRMFFVLFRDLPSHRSRH